jgi:hypothetical protein
VLLSCQQAGERERVGAGEAAGRGEGLCGCGMIKLGEGRGGNN